MRYLAYFNVVRLDGNYHECAVIEGNFNPDNPSDRELIEDDTPLGDESQIISVELISISP